MMKCFDCAPDREAAGGRRLAAELLEQPVIAATAGHRALRAESIAHPFEHRAIVVVEATHESGIDRERDAVVAEYPLQSVEVRARIAAQAIDQPRRRRDRRLQRGVLAVEDAQRIGMQPAPRIAIQQLLVPLEMRDQFDAMRTTLVGIADRIELEPDALEPKPSP